MGNDVLMTWLFIRSLKGIAFQLFRTLPVGSLKSWAYLKVWFLAHCYENDTEVFMLTFIEEKRRKDESVNNFIERFKNLSIRCSKDMPLSMLLQTCKHNLRVKIRTNMGAFQNEIIEKLISTL